MCGIDTLLCVCIVVSLVCRLTTLCSPDVNCMMILLQTHKDNIMIDRMFFFTFNSCKVSIGEWWCTCVISVRTFLEARTSTVTWGHIERSGLRCKIEDLFGEWDMFVKWGQFWKVRTLTCLKCQDIFGKQMYSEKCSHSGKLLSCGSTEIFLIESWKNVAPWRSLESCWDIQMVEQQESVDPFCLGSAVQTAGVSWTWRCVHCRQIYGSCEGKMKCVCVCLCSADERFDASFHTNILVNSTGYCQYLPPGNTQAPPTAEYTCVWASSSIITDIWRLKTTQALSAGLWRS